MHRIGSRAELGALAEFRKERNLCTCRCWRSVPSLITTRDGPQRLLRLSPHRITLHAFGVQPTLGRSSTPARSPVRRGCHPHHRAWHRSWRHCRHSADARRLDIDPIQSWCHACALSVSSPPQKLAAAGVGASGAGRIRIDSRRTRQARRVDSRPARRTVMQSCRVLASRLAAAARTAGGAASRVALDSRATRRPVRPRLRLLRWR